VGSRSQEGNMANITGTGGNDNLVGGNLNDVINGLAGHDTMTGLKGNDTYYVDDGMDTIVEKAGEGFDTVITSTNHSMWENVEKLVMAAGAGDLWAYGNDASNVLIGNEGNNYLGGSNGADTMQGGKGNDTYSVDDAGDKVIELANEGTDTVASALNFSLAALANVENLTLTAALGSPAIKGTGNALNNTITGNHGDNILDGAAGADTLQGGKGNDTYYVDSVGDVVQESADEGTDTVISKVALSSAFDNVENYDFSKLLGGVTFTGNELDNVIKGGAGVDKLAGGTGLDTYYLNSVKDVVIEKGGEGWDSIVTTFTTDLNNYANVEEIRLQGTAAINAFGSSDNNEIIGNSGANVIDGRGGTDAMSGGKGNDTYYVDQLGDGVWELAGGGVDTVISSVNFELGMEVENLTLVGFALQGTGNDLKNTIIGNGLNNILEGGVNADTMKGGAGDDEYQVDDVGDNVIENAGEGTDTVKSTIDFSLAALANLENLKLYGDAVKATGNALGNAIDGNDLDNVIDGGGGADTMKGGKGNDTYYINTIGDVALENFGEGSDWIVSSFAFANVYANIENYDFSKVAGGVNFTGDGADNIIKGAAGIDTLVGLGGNDTYYVNSTQDVVKEDAFAGSDTVATGAFSIELSKYANVEHAKLTGIAALNATGTDIGNVLIGNDGANVLDGKGAADTMIGGKGNDTYYVDNDGDMITENDNGGVDTVISSVFYHELAANVENLIITYAGAFSNGIGNEGKNLIIGNSQSNTIDGGKNADTMKGGAGNDQYYVDQVGDKVIELANEGTDIVSSTIDFSLAALTNLEMLRLAAGAADALKGTGNSLNNRLIGNEFDNILDGGAGADELWGSKGNDTYYIDNKGDSIAEVAGEGTDTVISKFAFSSAIANVENYDFSKVAVAVDFTGTDGANVIKGGSAIDTLTGGLGNDTYYVNSGKDVIVEAAGKGSGTDTIVTSTFSIDLSNYANVENATLTGTTALKLTGTAGVANVLTGNAGANVIDGKDGAGLLGDTLIGGKGNDTYFVRGVNDVVIEQFDEGIDTVQASVSHQLGDHVENLVLTGNATEGTGNGLKNVITGNALNNTLHGGENADTMKGGKGDDTYLVDNKGDKIVELAGEGHDSVIATVDFSLAALVNVEDLFLDDSAVKGTGNSLANRIVGTWGHNVLNGGAGADTLEGLTGFDEYYVDNLNDLVIEDFNGGELDIVYSTVALTNAFANVEAYDFTKATSAVNFSANDANNKIWGSAFADTLKGAKGDDDYYLNNVGDKVQELSGEGNDRVFTTASVSKLWDNVENVYFKDTNSTAAWNATGNELDNTIRGNAGANKLSGGAGDDWLEGQGGNDILTGGEGTDVFVIEYASALSTNDILTDFDGTTDKLYFMDYGNDTSTFIKDIVDLGAGKDVVLNMVNGGKITFAGIGTGSIDTLAELVTDPNTQIWTS
jgi:Ca2+-binding RTX toxin-like protein